MTQITIEQHEFLDWLREREEDAVIGESGRPLRCPVAHFLNETIGGLPSSRDNFAVRYERVWGRIQGEELIGIEPPQWVRDFVAILDDMNGYQPVTRRACEAALSRIHQYRG